MMRIKILGSGTSSGVPVIGCKCRVCTSDDPKDKRLRSSVLVDVDDTRILIDCGPDFRQQIMPEVFKKIDGVLLTHHHYDHVGGLDDLRSFNKFGTTDIYANDICASIIEKKAEYYFQGNTHANIPSLKMHIVFSDVPFYINKVKIIPIQIFHGRLPILGFRIKNFVYITDMKTIEEKEMDQFEGVKVAIVNGLRHEPHPTHQTIEESVAFMQRINVAEGYITHIADSGGLHAEMNKILPTNIKFAFDNQELNLL